jgi:hypothetical protein
MRKMKLPLPPTFSITELNNHIAESGQKPEQYLASAGVYEKNMMAKLEAAARASTAVPEYRVAILQFLEQLDGKLLEQDDMPPSDICAGAGVPLNKGTARYARIQRDKLVLEHRRRQEITQSQSGE